MKDPVVNEVRKAGAAIAKRCGYDILTYSRLMSDTVEKYKQQGWKVAGPKDLREKSSVTRKKACSL